MTRATNNSFNPSKTIHWINHELAEGRLDGCGLQVVYQGQTVFNESFGVWNSKGDQVTQDTRYWIASMTKPVVSVVALHLIECGKLSLQDNVSEYVEGFGDAGVLTPAGDTVPVSRPPTVLDLLIHTTGVTYGQLGEQDIHRQYTQAGVFDYSSTNAKMAERLAKLPLLYQPGTTFEYGMSTDLLGHLLEIVTARSLDKILEDIIFNPLGMTSTSFSPEQGRVAELAPSIVQETVAPDFKQCPSWFSGGAGLYSTVSDYIRFARLLRGCGQLNDVQILKPETFVLMSQPSLPAQVNYGEYTASLGISAPWNKNGLTFGLGLAVRTEELESIPGGIDEFFWPGISGANFWVDPKNDLVVVFLNHAPLHRTIHRVQLRDAIYGGLCSGA